MDLVLKDASGADITLSYIGSVKDGLVFEKVSDTLVGRLRVTVSLTENAKTNRIRGKLTRPVVATLPQSGELPVVQYTEITSFDVSVYKAGQETGRTELQALFSSLLDTPLVKSAIIDGVKPSK